MAEQSWVDSVLARMSPWQRLRFRVRVRLIIWADRYRYWCAWVGDDGGYWREVEGSEGMELELRTPRTGQKLPDRWGSVWFDSEGNAWRGPEGAECWLEAETGIVRAYPD